MTKQECEIFLKDILENFTEEYNIFLHEVSASCYDRYRFIDSSIKVRTSKIIENGLDLSYYGSICGTLNFIGVNKNVDMQKILDYDYYTHLKTKNIIVVAIPKYIMLDGQKVEFSSFNGKSSREDIPELIEVYKKYGGRPDLHHTKFCLYDTVKPYDLDICFQLGLLTTDKSNDDYNFQLNPKHISYLNQEEKNLINKKYEEKIKKCQSKFEASNLTEFIVQASKEDEKWWNAKDECDI